jgi:hypothetical protein
LHVCVHFPSPGSWRWSDNTIFDYSNFGYNEPTLLGSPFKYYGAMWFGASANDTSTERRYRSPGIWCVKLGWQPGRRRYWCVRMPCSSVWVLGLW